MQIKYITDTTKVRVLYVNITQGAKAIHAIASHGWTITSVKVG